MKTKPTWRDVYRRWGGDLSGYGVGEERLIKKIIDLCAGYDIGDAATELVRQGWSDENRDAIVTVEYGKIVARRIHKVAKKLSYVPESK